MVLVAGRERMSHNQGAGFRPRREGGESGSLWGAGLQSEVGFECEL